MTEPLATTTSTPKNTGASPSVAGVPASSALVPVDIQQTDVVIGADCLTDANRLNDVIQDRARGLMGSALKKAYDGVFPAHTEDLLDSAISKIVTPENICHSLRTPLVRPGEDRNALIKKYKNARLAMEKAKALGIVSERFELKADCNMRINYKQTGHYSDVENCENVAGELNHNPVPFTLAILPFESNAVCGLFAEPQFQKAYKNYPDRGPSVCTSSNDEHTDTYNNISGGPLGTDVEFGLRGFSGRNWSATRMITSCTEQGKDGEEHDDMDDMKFIFSARACVPLDFVVGGERRQYTLYLDQVTAAPNTVSFKIASSVAAKKTYDVSFEYLLGSMLAKFLAAEKRLK